MRWFTRGISNFWRRISSRQNSYFAQMLQMIALDVVRAEIQKRKGFDLALPYFDIMVSDLMRSGRLSHGTATRMIRAAMNQLAPPPLDDYMNMMKKFMPNGPPPNMKPGDLPGMPTANNYQGGQ